MLRKKAAALLLSLAMILSFCACGNGGSGGYVPVEIEWSEYEELPEIRFSSFYGRESGGVCRLKMRVPFDDSYTVDFSSDAIGNITVYGEDGKILASSHETFDIELKENDLVYLAARGLSGNVKIDVTAKNHLEQLPFAVEGAPDTAQFETTSVEGDPLEPALLAPKFRGHGKYIISSSPETLEPKCINTALTRHDVSDEEIFFTFEHNTAKITTGMYYGYQVLNTGEEDAYITVKNIGFQTGGRGAWYGESAWVSFYNTSFALPDMSEWSDEVMKSYVAWFNFAGDSRNPKFQPITYRIPAGQYIYVLGGTTADAFNRYNVANTANKRAQGGCQNGAVLFEVAGKAEGIFYVYDDPSKVGADNKTPGGGPPKADLYPGNIGLNGINDGTVVETKATWTFNDVTPEQFLPVGFTNYYVDAAFPKGESFGKVDYTPRERECTLWYTNCNSHFQKDALGVDTVALHSTCDGDPVIVGIDYYDANGDLTDMGNWMVDYIDTYTFVNRGNNDRQITVMVNPCVGGAMTVFARDEQGNRIAGSERFSMYYPSREYGDFVEGEYYYTFTAPAHGVKQISFEYNLLANAYGRVSHSVELK